MDQKIKLPSLPFREEALMAFGATLTKLRLKAGKSRYRLSKYSGIDQAYINRLETGNRQNPSRDLVFRLALALVENSEAVNIDDVDELLIAAAHEPLRRRC